MIERMREINKLRRKDEKLQKLSGQRNDLISKLDEMYENESDKTRKFRLGFTIEVVKDSFPRIERKRNSLRGQMELIAEQGLRELTSNVLAPITVPEAQHAAQEQTPEISAPELPIPQPEKEEPARKPSARKERKERKSVLSTESWKIPNGKILKLSLTRYQILSTIEKGLTKMDRLKKITGKNTSYISSTISQLNKSLKPNKLLIYNLSEAKQFGAKYVLQWLGTEKAILATDKPAKRSYEKKARPEIYSKGAFRIEIPNGKKVEITGGLQWAIYEATNRGIYLRDDIIMDIYGEVTDKTISSFYKGVQRLNDQLEPHNYKLTHPTFAELKKGTPYEYKYAQIAEEKTSEEIVEESETSETLTNYEAATIVYLLSSDETLKEFKERGIPVLDREKMNFIMEYSSVSSGTKLTNEEMRLIRANTIRKVKEICDTGAQGKIYDKVAMDSEPKNAAVAEFMLYLADLQDKEPEAFEIILKNLGNIKNMHWTLDRGQIYHIGHDGEKTPVPTPISRWEKHRVETEVTRIVKSEDEGARAVVETVVTETQERSSGITTVYDTSGEDMPRESVTTVGEAGARALQDKTDPDVPLKPPVLSKETGEPEQYKLILKKDPDAVKNMRDSVGQVFTLFSSEPTSGQFVHTFHGIKRSRIELAREKGYIKRLQANQGTPRLSYTDAAVLSYLGEHDPKQTLTSREISDVRKMADQIVETTLKRTKRMTKVRGNGNR